MPKNIVICADGTGNTTIKGRGTNVFKLYEAVDENGHRFDPTKTPQVAIYHDGVGTENLKWIRIFAGATGYGLGRNVKQLYGELSRVYDPGDRIYLFGFSRGAFTVRTLAGLVITCGILDPGRYLTNREFWRAVREAYGEYRKKYQTVVSRALRGTVTVDKNELRQRFSVAMPAFTDAATKIIDFIGVWDTVDAVGLPLGIADAFNAIVFRFKFPDRFLSPDIGHACQCLALDEERQSFKPVLWEEQPGGDARIEQVWFAGVHSNVGGGYPRQGMSLVALDWMMTKAEQHGLRFLPAPRQAYRDGCDSDDKLYDSRAGLGVLYRWKPRNVDELCRLNNVPPRVHRTVYQRIARNTDGYAPGSVPPDAEVITTSNPGVAVSLRQLVAGHFGTGGPLLLREMKSVRLGTITYGLFMALVIALGLLMIRMYVSDLNTAGDWKTMALQIATTIASTNWLGIAARTVWHHWWIAVAACAVLFLSLAVNHSLDDRYSAFWHTLRAPIRKLLES